MKKQFQSKSVPRGTRTIWRYLGALFLLFTFAIGNVWAADYTLLASTATKNDAADPKSHDWTFSTQTFALSPQHGGTGQTGYSDYIKFSKKKTYTIALPDGFVLTNINIKGYTNSNGATDGEITKVNGVNQSSKTFPAKDDSNLASKTQITNGYDFAISQTGGNVTFTTANTNQICVLITITGTPAASGPVDPTITFNNGAYTLGATALDLSSLFTSNSKGTVTYSVKKDGGTSASISGSEFSATAAGTCVVTATQAAETGKYNAGTADANIVVSAPAATHSVIPATEDISKGTAAAAATTVAEGATTTITATPLAGYVFDHWVVSGAGATLSSTSTNPTTLTMGTADATVTAYFAEKTCPTSGEVFYMEITSTASSVNIAAQTTVELGTYGTFRGGSASITNGATETGKAYINNSAKTVSINGNAAYVTLNLDCPLKTGDQLTFVSGSGSNQICFTTDLTRSTSNITSGNKWTVPAAFNDVSTIYIWRNSSHTYIRSITITRPYNVTFVSDHGTAPTTPTKALSFTLTELSDASFTHTGWTADKAVKVGGETKAASTALAVDATVELTDNTTFTATWEAKAATFAVTYKANNGTSEADINDPAASTFAANTFTVPDGKMFAGWNTQADGEGTNYAVDDAVTEAITVYAKWVVDPTIRLILKSGDTYSINTDKFTVYEGTELQNEEYTVDGKTFAKNFKFGGNCSSTPFAGQAWSNKFMAYDVASNSTDIKLYVYNKNSGNKKLYYQIVPEGSAAAAFQSVTITSKATNQVVNIPTITAAKGARVLFGVEAADVRICQIEVLENGTALPTFGTNGYEFSVPGRAATYNKVGAFDGFEFKTNADLKFISGQNYIALRNIDGSQYVKFTVATNIQLQVTTPNTNKFYVSKTAAGDAEKDTQYGGSAATHNVNLHAGTYYIAPAAGSSGGEVQITKLAFATAPEVKTVTFNSDGGSPVEEQEVFAGEKAVEPEAPTKSGYRFVEWQQSGSAYDFDDEVTTDITLDAVWQKTWKVTFDADNGSDPVVVTVDNNQAVAQPANPEKSGFDFVEWQLSGSAYNFATLVTGDITLTATWEVAQDDASLSALSYNGNAIDVASAEEVSGVQTYTYHLPWGSTIDPALVSVTKNAESADMSAIVYNSENKQATFMVTSGNGSVSINYAIQFVIDAKRGTSIVKAIVSGGDQKAGFAATGIYGDKGYAYTRNNKKLDTADKFVGVKLISGKTFATGDKLFVVTSTDADMGYIEIYEEAEGTNLIKATDVRDASEGIEVPELAGYSEFYIVRKASTGDQAWNGFVDYVEVTREMNPAIKSFKFGDDAATINESAKTISIEVPYATDVTALTPTVEAYGNNGATYTPAGAKDFTSPVVYTVTDAYNELHTDYTVTVNIAAPSTNAYLASLSVAGYALDFNKETTTYNIVLDYGTTVLPEITYAVEDAGLATAVKVEGGVNGATTITVTPQAGVGYEKVYTINFSVNTTPTFKVFDGRTMNAAIVSFTDPTSGMTWTSEDATTSSSSNTKTINGKTYTKSVKIFGSATSASRYLKFTVPADYVAKFYLAGSTNSSTGEATLFFSKELTADPAKAIAGLTASVDDPKWAQTDYQLPGDYYFCVTGSARIYELSVTLYPIDEERAMTQGRFGTICYPNGGRLLGAMLLEIAYFDPDQKKIFFDEVIGGQMVAGAPYLFLPNEGVDKFAIVYTDNVNASAGHHNGLYGSYTQEALPTDGNHYIMLNNQYCKVVEANTYVGANRAYIQLDKIGNDYVAPAYGRRRVSLGVQQAEVATGLEDLNVGDQPIKIMINGQMYILRGEKMYDATGRLVK